MRIYFGVVGFWAESETESFFFSFDGVGVGAGVVFFSFAGVGVGLPTMKSFNKGHRLPSSFIL